MVEEKSAPDQAAVELLFRLRWGWLGSQGIYVAAELGIADLLSDGPKTVDQLASSTGNLGRADEWRAVSLRCVRVERGCMKDRKMG